MFDLARLGSITPTSHTRANGNFELDCLATHSTLTIFLSFCQYLMTQFEFSSQTRAYQTVYKSGFEIKIKDSIELKLEPQTF